VNADDNRLISECLAGNTAAFGELVTRYQDRLYNTVFRLVNQPEDARDAVQEAFLSAYQSLATFKGDSLFSSWVYRVAANTALMRLRSQRRHPQISTEDLPAGFLEYGEYPYVTAGEIKKALALKQAFSSMLDHMQ